jgi:parallel beta-helix repeat protein
MGWSKKRLIEEGSGRRLEKKAVSGIVLMLLLTSMLSSAFNIQPVKASGTIYIRADGSIDPPTAPILTLDKITYTFTDNIYNEILVERDNIVLEGAGHTLQGTGSGTGIALSHRSSVTIKNIEIKGFTDGVYLSWSSYNTISGNNMTNNIRYGIGLYDSHYNIISGNYITNNGDGVYLRWSSNNVVSRNTIANNGLYGVQIDGSYNRFFHNSFIHNTRQAMWWIGDDNVWDDGYPSGGNYWSDYTGIDLKRGPNQDKPGSDGIGDTPYIIDDYNRDRYPLMEPWAPAPPKQKKIEVKIVSPKKGEIFFINPAPKMPIINCKAQISGISPDPTYVSEFSWEANLSYTWKHRGELRFQSFLFKERVIGGSWTPDFGSIIMGGDMKITVAITIGGIKYEDSILIEIRGENPNKEAVKAELGELKYQILAYMESKPKWCQFDKKGLPIFGPPSGYGLMQLDPPPSYKEIWDWKADVKAGKEHFDEDIEAAKGYAAYVRNYYGGKEPVTDLSEEQIFRQAYYSYNAGRAYWKSGKWWPYYVWDAIKDEWVINKDASSQGKKYADTAMEYLNDVLQGKPPKNW